jgi:hypothetical protein
MQQYTNLSLKYGHILQKVATTEKINLRKIKILNNLAIK